MAPLAPRVIVWNEDAGREEGLEAEALVATCPSSLPHADQITTLGFVRGAKPVRKDKGRGGGTSLPRSRGSRQGAGDCQCRNQGDGRHPALPAHARPKRAGGRLPSLPERRGAGTLGLPYDCKPPIMRWAFVGVFFFSDTR